MKLPSEHSEQAGLVMWFRTKFPTVLIYAVPNGEKRAMSVAVRLKAEGVVSGVPDLHVPQWGLWIEMKRTRGGVVSPAQRDMIEYLEGIGDTVFVPKGAREASVLILDFVGAARPISGLRSLR